MPERPGRVLVARGAGGAVASGHGAGVDAGLELFEQGGNAVDAAVGAAAALMVALPHACGLGGDALALVRAPDGAVSAFNGSGRASRHQPADVPPLDHGAGVAVPGAVHALAAILERHGRQDLAAALAPAADLAARGLPLPGELEASRRAHAHRLGHLRGWPPLAGDGRLGPHPELAATLEAIGAQGAGWFYEGPPAQAIVRAARDAGGVLDAGDLAGHDTPSPAPVALRHHSALVTLAPPVSQAALAGMALQVLGRHAAATEVDRVHLGVEAIEAAFAVRDDLAALSDPDALLGLELDVDPARAARRGGPRGYSHTTSVVTADAEGRVVSMLVSLFDPFGSAVLVPEHGFLLNDRLTGFSRDARSPNAPAPGRRPVHTLSPAIGERPGEVRALASPGADGQVQFLCQIVDALVARELAPEDALARPRWRTLDGRVALEAGTPAAVVAGLEERGHACEVHPWGDVLFGAAVSAGVESGSGEVLAVADGRLDTAAGALG